MKRSPVSSDQRAASVCARSVGALPVRHGARAVAQRGRAECDGPAGQSADAFLDLLRVSSQSSSLPLL